MKTILLTLAATLLICNLRGQSLLNVTYLQKKLSEDKVLGVNDTDKEPFDFFQTNPGFLSMLDNGVTLVPNIDIQFSRTKENSWATYTLKVFTGSATIDTTLQNNAIRLLLPEASKFGIKVNCVKPFRLMNSANASLNMEINYLYKDFPLKKDSQIVGSYSANMLHGKAGFDVILITDMISAYYNLNGVYVLTGVDNMKTLFNKSVDYYVFHEMGFKLFFDLDGDKKATSNNILSIDLGAIPVNGEIFKLYNSTHDNIIPLIRIGYLKTIH